MSEVNDTIDLLAARLSKGILSGDSALVSDLLRTCPNTEVMYAAYSLVINDISLSMDTPGLDAVMKEELRKKRSDLFAAVRQVNDFIVERKVIERMEDGHPKHVAMMEFYGAVPMDLESWQQLQDELSLAER
jgi:hypothetical protein